MSALNVNSAATIAATANADFSDNSSAGDDDVSSPGHSDDDDDDDGDDGHPMMSIFASYYGIEDPSAQVDDGPKGTIDDAGFQPDKFVRVRDVYLSLLPSCIQHR
jgi:hypothetical protein